MTNSSPIALQILILSVALSVLWGIYFGWTLKEWIRVTSLRLKTRGDVLGAFRRMLAAWCLFVLPLSVVVRTLLVLIGVGDAVVGQILFFALAGSNFIGALFAVISLRVD